MMARWIAIAGLAVLGATSCGAGGGSEDEITGICVYDDGARPAACRNLWNDDATCPDEDAVGGGYDADTVCSEAGFSTPCTHDHPGSLWVTDEADCADWEE